MLKRVLIGVVLILGIGGIAMVVTLSRQTEAVMQNLTIEDVDLASIPDGTYVGEYDAKLVFAKVRTTVKDHRITGIEILEHRNGRGKAGEKVADEILSKQSLNVDAVTGATTSSKVITKAVEVSLKRQ